LIVTDQRFPEHEKLLQISEQSQSIGEFLEWMHGTKGWTVAYVPSYYESTLVPVSYNINELLAEFFGIDLKKVEAEKRAMLDEMRSSTA
jgi:hypothetical protein